LRPLRGLKEALYLMKADVQAFNLRSIQRGDVSMRAAISRISSISVSPSQQCPLPGP
jgi:hypothetical protein